MIFDENAMKNEFHNDSCSSWMLASNDAGTDQVSLSLLEPPLRKKDNLYKNVMDEYLSDT